MTNDPSPNQAQDRLIEILADGQSSSDADDVMADLSEEQRREFEDARQAIRILENAIPATGKQLDQSQSAVETPAINKAETQHDSEKRTIDLPAIQNLGHYQVLETLGQGGFGIVVKARDSKLLRTVALKIPKVERLLKDQEGRERFVREARLVAMLSHPAIVPIFETGIDGPILFIASAYCNGGTLAQWFSDQQESIAPSLAAKIVARLAEAVQHAHQRGVVHRDLKPGNILLDFDEGSSSSDADILVSALRITDFGLAKFLDDDQTVTQSGATIGTPAYMSPEQARGDVEKIGSSSDIYGLGAILYELLAGRPPIVGDSILATMRAIETQPPEPPRILNPQVSRDLSAICLKCLEKDPRHRYVNAQELQADLSAYLDGKPVRARPAGRATRLARWSQRNPAIAVALSVAMLALTIGLAFSIAYGISENRATKLADMKSAEALSQTRLARKAVDDLQRAIAEEPLLKSKGMQSFRKKLLNSANEYYQLVSNQRPDDDEVLHEYVEILKGLAYLNAELGDRSTAISILEETITLQKQEFPEEPTSIAKTKLELARNLGKVRRHDEAIAIANSAVDTLSALTETDDLATEIDDELIRGLCQLSTSQSLKGKHADADTSADQALLIASEKNGLPQNWPANRLMGMVLERKAHVALRLQKHDDVDKFAPLAIELLERVSENDPEARESCLFPIATMHSLQGASYNVRRMYEQALRHFALERVLLDELIGLQPEVASQHAQSANQLLRFAKCLYESGDVQRAREELNAQMPKIIEAMERFPEENVLYITMVLCHQLTAKTFRKDNDLASATIELDKGIELCEQLCESNQTAAQLRVILSTLYMEQSTFYLQQKSYENAANECERGLKILEDLYQQERAGQHVGQLEFAYMLYGNAMIKLERFQEFLDATKLVAEWPRVSPNIQKAKAHQIIAYAGVNQWDQARGDFELIAQASTSNQSCLDLAGLASKCAGIAATSLDADDENYNHFIDRSLEWLAKARDRKILEDESAVKLLNEHPDFAEVRRSDAFADLFR